MEIDENKNQSFLLPTFPPHIHTSVSFTQMPFLSYISLKNTKNWRLLGYCKYNTVGNISHCPRDFLFCTFKHLDLATYYPAGTWFTRWKNVFLSWAGRKHIS